MPQHKAWWNEESNANCRNTTAIDQTCTRGISQNTFMPKWEYDKAYLTFIPIYKLVLEAENVIKP